MRKPFIQKNGTIHIKWFQSTDDSDLWSKHHHHKSNEIDIEFKDTDTIKNDPQSQGQLAIVSGFFSIPGTLLIIKNFNLLPAKLSDFA